MYGQLSSGTNKWGGQWIWYKDTLHRSLKKANIAPSTWEDLAQDCIWYGNSIRKGIEAAEKGLKEASEEKHRKHHNRTPAIGTPTGLICKVCGKQCWSRISLYSHSKMHCSNPVERNHHHLMRWIVSEWHSHMYIYIYGVCVCVCVQCKVSLYAFLHVHSFWAMHFCSSSLWSRTRPSIQPYLGVCKANI